MRNSASGHFFFDPLNANMSDVWTRDWVNTPAPTVMWPSSDFWSDANAIIGGISAADVDAILHALKMSHLATAFADATTMERMETTVRKMWARGWSDIQSFTHTHPPPNPRCIASISISYFAAIVCTMLVPHKEKSVDDAHLPLLGTCIGMIYSDNYIDDPNVSSEERANYMLFMSRRFESTAVKPYDAFTHAANAAFQMVEQSSTCKETYEALRAILHTHHTAAKGHTSDDDDAYRRLALKLGAQTGITLASVVCAESSGVWPTVALMGAWMQLLDDAADIDDDIADRIETYATRLYRRDGCLDEYWTLLRAIAEHTAANLRSMAKQTWGQGLGDAFAFFVLLITGMSYAKLRPRLKARDPTIDCDAMEIFYTKWRAAYERTVVQMIREMQMRRHWLIGRLVLSVVQWIRKDHSTP